MWWERKSEAYSVEIDRIHLNGNSKWEYQSEKPIKLSISCYVWHSAVSIEPYILFSKCRFV